MAKRYGRNQRRAHREYIALLEAQNAELRTHLVSAAAAIQRLAQRQHPLQPVVELFLADASEGLAEASHG